MVSLAGEAVMRFPATVPRLRICGAPTSQAARARGVGLFAEEFTGRAVIVGHQRAQVNDAVFVQADVVQAGNAADVYDGVNAWARAAFQFQNQVGAARHDARGGAFFGQDLCDLLNTDCVNVFSPHEACLLFAPN